jgi:hypothetical protein
MTEPPIQPAGATDGCRDPIIGGGGGLVYPSIHSPDFSLSGQTGWAILKNGDAYFFNITAEGTITADKFVGTNFEINPDGFFLYSGAPAFGNLIGSDAPAAGIDQYGNPYVQDTAAYVVLTGTYAGTYAVELANQSTPYGPTLAGLTITNLSSPPSLPPGMAGANNGSGSGSRYRILSGAGAAGDEYMVIDTYSADANPYSAWFAGALAAIGPAIQTGTLGLGTVLITPTSGGCQLVADIWNYVGSGHTGPIDTAPNFASDWANFGSGDAPLAYRMTADNSVEIDGVITPSAGATSLLFTLPGEYLPRTNQWVFGANVSAGQAGWWIVHTNGQVTTGNSVVAGDAYVINGKYSLNV